MMRSSVLAAAATLALIGGRAQGEEAPVQCNAPLLSCQLDGGLRITATGRLQLDRVRQTGDGGDGLWTKVRRARVGLKLDAPHGLQAQVEHEFAVRPGWRNVWVRARLGHAVSIRAGNFTAPFSLEDRQSSSVTPFVERSLAQALAPGYGLGAEASWRGSGWTLTGGWFGDALKDDDGTRRRRGHGVVARATFAPIDTHEDLAHFGLSFERRTTDPGYGFHAQTGPEAAFAPELIHSRGLTQARAFTSVGGEAAIAHKSVLVQGQLIETRIERDNGPDVVLKSGYVQAAWIVSGQRRAYSRTSATPGAVLLDPGRGAVELAARFSVLDLRDQAAPGGIARDATLGANWYVNDHVRLMADYIRAWAQHRPGEVGRAADVVALRLQAAF